MIGRGHGQPVAASTTPGTPVTWLEFVADEDLPAIVAAQDVALGLFSCKERAQRVVPRKIFQAAAAGCAIVTAETKPQLRLLGDAAEFVPCGDADSLANRLKAMAADPDHVAKLRRSAHDLAARSFTPGAIVQPLIVEVGRNRTAR
jgi:glycosyltransferase involved in cell wall biosynthesis